MKVPFNWYLAPRGPDCIQLFPESADPPTPEWVRKRYEEDAPLGSLIQWRTPTLGLFGIKQSREELCVNEIEVRHWVLWRYHERGEHQQSEIQVELAGVAARRTLLKSRRSECRSRVESLFSVLRLWYSDRVAYEEMQD
jgi:hypothetical protein